MQHIIAEHIPASPKIGDKAPSFNAVSTQGEIAFPDKFAGSWVILFSNPGDFTPVCVSEFLTFASMEEEFAKYNCKLVGLSIDAIHTQLSWLEIIKKKIEFRGMKNVEVNFPLIEDVSLEVAKKYGMIQPEESTTKPVRAVFVIDPRGIIRTIIYYPLCLGRNFDELLRIIVALQTSDAFSVATPANWLPGEEVVVHPAGSIGAIKDNIGGKDDDKCYDWYACTKKIDKDTIIAKISQNVK